MADTFQNEVPRARINLKLSLHTGGAQKRSNRSNCLPLAILVMLRKTGLYRKEKNQRQ